MELFSFSKVDLGTYLFCTVHHKFFPIRTREWRAEKKTQTSLQVPFAFALHVEIAPQVAQAPLQALQAALKVPLCATQQKAEQEREETFPPPLTLASPTPLGIQGSSLSVEATTISVEWEGECGGGGQQLQFRDNNDDNGGPAIWSGNKGKGFSIQTEKKKRS